MNDSFAAKAQRTETTEAPSRAGGPHLPYISPLPEAWDDSPYRGPFVRSPHLDMRSAEWALDQGKLWMAERLLSEGGGLHRMLRDIGTPSWWARFEMARARLALCKAYEAVHGEGCLAADSLHRERVARRPGIEVSFPGYERPPIGTMGSPGASGGVTEVDRFEPGRWSYQGQVLPWALPVPPPDADEKTWEPVRPGMCPLLLVGDIEALVKKGRTWRFPRWNGRLPCSAHSGGGTGTVGSRKPARASLSSSTPPESYPLSVSHFGEG